MKPNMLLIQIILMLLVTGIMAQTDSSVIFNKTGYEYYETGQYEKAASAFEMAVSYDYSNYIAYYNLACTYSILTSKNATCNSDYYVKAIHALQECISLDSLRTVRKAAMDKDFYGLKDEYEFNVLINGLSFEDPKYAESFLMGKTYRTSIPGSTYYPIDELTLNADHTWNLVFHKNAEAMIYYWHKSQEGPPPELILGSKTGFWKLEGYTLLLLDENKKLMKKVEVTDPSEVDGLYYPDPNDYSGMSEEIRHFWKCGKCGCGYIEEL